MSASLKVSIRNARKELLDAEFSALYLGGPQSAIVGARKKINALEWGIVDGESLWKEVRTGNVVRKVRV